MYSMRSEKLFIFLKKFQQTNFKKYIVLKVLEFQESFDRTDPI